jgi:cytochrome P450
MSAVWLLLLIAGAAIGYVVWRHGNRQRHVNEAPLVPSAIPYIGSAREFEKNPLEFLGQCRRRHGDVFTMYMRGHRTTFLVDPHDYAAVLSDVEHLDHRALAFESTSRAFGHGPGVAGNVEELERVTRERLRGADLELLTEVVQEQLDRRLGDLPTDRPIETSLHRLVEELLFATMAAAVFGDDSDTSTALEHFHRLDEDVPALLSGIPRPPRRSYRQARDALAARFGARQRPRESRVVGERRAVLRQALSSFDRARLQLAFVWEAQANTAPAAFWTMLYLLHDERARSAVTGEVRAAARSATDYRGTGIPSFSHDQLHQMATLSSAISEALRLTSAPLILRRITRAFTIRLWSGRDLALRAGDRVAIYPALTHRDPEIFEDPDDFQFDRFVADERPRHFRKGGKRILHSLAPFGGGADRCPGRHLARNVLKILVANLLHDFDIEVLSGEFPAFTQHRAGLGVLLPSHDVPVRLMRRRP